ncbi:putative transcriptional coactivator Hfi1/Transcriptional adapter 1 [Helianthus annuus]|nr:putative transcriptional coactivator Hfi1/Transcriptional adapter 1 [Helianthus annuus]
MCIKNAWLVTVGSKKPLDVVYHENASVPVVTRVTSPLTSPLNLVNGDILPPSVRKARTGARDRRVFDHKRALGPNGSTNFTPFSSSTPQTGDFRVVENGESSSPNHQELMKQAENGALVSVNRVEQTEPLCKTDGKIIHAPLGVPHFPITIGGTHMENNSKNVGVLHTDGLLDTTTLKERMEQITTLHGIQQVSMDCANVLNRGLDVYLKGLIRSCVELNGSRSSVHKPTQSDSATHPNHIQPVNDVLSGHHRAVYQGVQEVPSIRAQINIGPEKILKKIWMFV